MAAQPRYAPRNPILPFLPRIEAPVYVPPEIIGLRRWRESEYVLDYLKPIETTGVAGMTLRGPDGAIFGGIFLGNPEPKGFSRRTLARLRSIAGAVARGLFDMGEWEAWQRRSGTTLEPLLDGMVDPVIVIERTSSGAARLNIRYYTVTTHARTILGKLGVSGRVEALNAVRRRAATLRRR